MNTSSETTVKSIERFLAACEAELTAAAEELDAMTMPPLTEELFSLFERTGDRLGYENVYFLRRRFLSVYGILVSLCGRAEYLSRLEYVITEICREECWALPSHVDRRNDKDWRIFIDLFAAETGAYLAELIEALKGRLSSEVYELARSEVFRRVLTPFMNSRPPYAWWEISEMNWCAVCSGSVGIAAIHLVGDKVELDGLLQRLAASVRHYTDGFSDDGACLEGLGYYTYGMSFYVAFADMLLRYSEGRMNLFDGEKFRRIALFQEKCFLADGVTLSFSDSGQAESFRVGLTARLAMLCPEVSFPDFGMAAGLESDNCYRYLILSRDIIFAREYLESAEQRSEKTAPAAAHTVLPQAQWSLCRSSNGAVLAVKGGHNDEPHNHNDVGSLLYVVGTEQILTDIGAGEYTKDYFNENRYKYLCCRSLGHSVPLINGGEQKAGSEYRAARFEADGMGRTVIGLEKAYALSDGDKVTRTVEFDMSTGGCTITDEFLLADRGEITENLVTRLEPTVCENGFILRANTCVIQIQCLGGAACRTVREQYTDHFGKPREVYLMQWTVTRSTAQTIITIRENDV